MSDLNPTQPTPTPQKPEIPQIPKAPKAGQPAQPAPYSPQEMTPGLEAFARLLGPMATPQQVVHAMLNMINQMVYQVKHEQQRAEEQLKKMKREIEGDD